MSSVYHLSIVLAPVRLMIAQTTTGASMPNQLMARLNQVTADGANDKARTRLDKPATAVFSAEHYALASGCEDPLDWCGNESSLAESDTPSSSRQGSAVRDFCIPLRFRVNQ